MQTEYFFTFVIPPDVGISLFGPEHIFWLVTAAIVCIALVMAYRRTGVRGKRRIQLTVGSVIMASELLRITALVCAGVFSINSLPLHLCGIAAYLTFIHAILGRGELLGEFLYSLCMPGSLFALLTPDWVAYPVLNLLSINSFIVHILLVAYPLMLVCGGTVKPDVRRIPKCFLMLFLMAVPIAVFDRLTGANFMFLNWPSPGSPLEYFAKYLGKPGYILGYFPMLALVWAALYAPFVVRGRRKN